MRSKMTRLVPPAMDALHACNGKRFSYNWYKGTVSNPVRCALSQQLHTSTILHPRVTAGVGVDVSLLYVVSCNEEATQHCEEVRCLATAVYGTFVLHCLMENDMCINNYLWQCAPGRGRIDMYAFAVSSQCPQGGWNSSNTERQRRPCHGFREGQQPAA